MRGYRTLFRKILLMLAFCFLCTLFIANEIQAAETEQKTVRVGYYPVADYQEINEDGTYSGFSYDYYVQIQKYTRWNYEFVEANYADCVQMLQNGEIDIMCGLTDTPERRKSFILSDYSNSNTQNKLYAKADNKDFYYESYDTFDGCKVAILNGTRSDELDAYCNAHDFQVEIVHYNSYKEMEEVLELGEVDMIFAGNISTNANTKIVARMKKQPLYYATYKEKPELAKELNDALQKIVDNNPEFYTQMSEKYKIDGANAVATFTREEMDYINSGQQIYLIVNSKWAPITWYNETTGEYKGIFLDLLESLKAYSGLNIKPCTEEEFETLVENNPDIMGNALAVMPDDTTWAAKRSVMMTNHVVNTSIVEVSRTGSHTDTLKDGAVVALPNNFYLGYLLSEQLENQNVIYYDTVEECLDAVNNGKADITYQNQLVSSYYLSMLKYTNLYTSRDSGYRENLAFGVYIDSDTPLLSILDKSLLCIGTDEINRIVVANSHADEEFSIEGLYYSNPTLVSSIGIVLCGMFFLIIYFRMKATNAVKQGKQEKTLARFMGYVCTANEDVIEVNLKDKVVYNYLLDDTGNVTIEKYPYLNHHFNNFEEKIHPDDFEKLRRSYSEEEIDQMIDQNGGERYFECRAKGKNGEYQWFSYSIQVIPKDEEHPRNFILFRKNIDEAKREEEKQNQNLRDALETAKDASEAKGNFLSRISHEIRTPLNAIMGYLSMARQKDMDEIGVDHCLENSEMAAKHLLGIINDVLDMSSIESGKMKPAREKFNVKELVESLSTMFSGQANQKGIDFHIGIYDLEQEWVTGDKLRVNQILINLLSNAVKFTGEEGRVSFLVTQIECAKENCRIKFEVTDTGIGMSEEYRKRLFKPFEQENAKIAQKFGGTGLGLSIAWNLVAMMGGSIDVKSSPGIGSTFTVLLPFQISEEQEKQSDFSKLRTLLVEQEGKNCEDIKAELKQYGAKCDVVASNEKAVQRIKSRQQTKYAYDLCIMDGSVEEQETVNAAEMTEVATMPLQQSDLYSILLKIYEKKESVKKENIHKIDLTGLHVLVAEDNEMNMEIAVATLTKAGFVVDQAVDGEQAFHMFRESPEGTYQAILMDIQMPVMDGYEAARQIRGLAHPQAKSIPIIAVSANAFAEDVSAALACGMNGHISKPIDYEKLYVALEKCMPKEV